MTERVLRRVQAEENGFLPNVCGVTLCEKARSFEIDQTLNVQPLLGLEGIRTIANRVAANQTTANMTIG